MYDDLSMLDTVFFNEVSDAAEELVKKMISARSSDEAARRMHAVIAGKALVILGVTWIGTAFELEAAPAIDVGEQALKQLKQMAQSELARRRAASEGE